MDGGEKQTLPLTPHGALARALTKYGQNGTGRLGMENYRNFVNGGLEMLPARGWGSEMRLY